MSHLKRLIVEIHERLFWHVPAYVHLARDLTGAGQLAADVLQPVTEKPRARE